MKRRDFIRSGALVSSYMLVPQFLKSLGELNLSSVTSKNLVIVQLSGGNDWLNTIVPFQNDVYFKSRPQIALKKNNVTALEKDLWLNNKLSPLKQFYDSGEIAILNNVGYPNPDRSHFRSMDIWHSASSSNEYWDTGWLGRFLDSECQNSHQAISVDGNLSMALKGENLNGMAIKNVQKLYSRTKEPFFNKIIESQKSEMLNEDNQGYLYKTLIQTSESAKYIYETSKLYRNNFTYPDHALSKQFKTVADFIGSGLNTRVYYITLGGFDTHVGQGERHDSLLNKYAESLTAFIKNLKRLDKWKDTLIFTFSEFGRRVQENGSFGTDHGTAGNVLLFGANLKKRGIVNTGPDLENLDDGDLKYNLDFREIYADILLNWLSADPKIILKKDIIPFGVI